MTWWDNGNNGKNGYNKENNEVTKYHRITDGGSNGDHDHEFYDPRTGVTGYHGYDTDRKDYGEVYGDFADNNGKTRR